MTMDNPAFWLAAWQIILINIILSGDNAVVIALACRMLPPRQRFWGMIFGAGAAVLLRIIFTIVITQLMGVPYLKLVGGVLLLWIAIKLLAPAEFAWRGQRQGRGEPLERGQDHGHRGRGDEPRQCDRDRRRLRKGAGCSSSSGW